MNLFVLVLSSHPQSNNEITNIPPNNGVDGTSTQAPPIETTPCAPITTKPDNRVDGTLTQAPPIETTPSPITPKPDNGVGVALTQAPPIETTLSPITPKPDNGVGGVMTQAPPIETTLCPPITPKPDNGVSVDLTQAPPIESTPSPITQPDNGVGGVLTPPTETTPCSPNTQTSSMETTTAKPSMKLNMILNIPKSSSTAQQQQSSVGEKELLSKPFDVIQQEASVNRLKLALRKNKRHFHLPRISRAKKF